MKARKQIEQESMKNAKSMKTLQQVEISLLGTIVEILLDIRDLLPAPDERG